VSLGTLYVITSGGGSADEDRDARVIISMISSMALGDLDVCHLDLVIVGLAQDLGDHLDNAC